MRLKRMEAQDVSIGEIRFKVRPLGAMNAAYVFGDVTAIVLPIMGTVAVSSGNDDEASGMEMFQGMNLDSESLANALGKINGQKLTALLDELVLKYGNVSFQDEDDHWVVLTRSDFDEIFCADLIGAVKLCAAVIRQNYSGFFDGLSTLFGNLMSGTQAARSKNTEVSTQSA